MTPRMVPYRENETGTWGACQCGACKCNEVTMTLLYSPALHPNIQDPRYGFVKPVTASIFPSARKTKT